MSTIKITGGLDVGNGYTKVALRASGGDPDRFDIPSSVALATSAADLTLPDSVAAKEVENDFFNALDATFTSPLVKTTHRHLFGRRGIESATSRYGEAYLARRAETRDRVHTVECVRCGPSGKPAQPGSPWSGAHQQADALRILAKLVLEDLWRIAREHHTGVPIDEPAYDENDEQQEPLAA